MDGVPIDSESLNVLYEDNHCLVVEKPAGLLMAGDSTGDLSLLDICKDYVKRQYNKPGKVFLGVVQRLDRPVSGVSLFARTSKSASRLSEQYRKHTIEKTYLAWVSGRPENRAELHDFLLKDTQRNFVEVVGANTSGAKSASLSYELLEREGRFSLLEIRPRTGRSHQIRVQLASRGLNVVGDVKYGAKQTRRPEAIALHAHSLEFEHPTQRTPIVVHLPQAGDWLSSF
jgi:23S rRNA pseudouridine1911/1915/1917 synthase